MKIKETDMDFSYISSKMSRKIINTFEEQNELFPNRFKEIHNGCCKFCPSKHNNKHSIIDPESAEIKMLPKEQIVQEFLFVCGWRGNKLCKGLCDYYGIDERFIKCCTHPNI